MNLKTLTAVAAATLLGTSFAYAGADKPSSSSASSGSTAQPQFKSLDKNSDGSLSRDEVKTWSGAKNFSKLDANHDGKLSSQEYAAAGSTSSSSSAAGGTSKSSSTPKKY